MSHRRLSSTEKGKGLDLGSQQPPRAARVMAPLPDNSELLRKHSLTLIGRVTNRSVQKVWSLIPFFTENWKTEFKPVGADLGNGLFQFQFERETDLLAVLDQRPYHYARWMVILQRWEPTVSPHFPSLIPFWIKVQGLPVHLWTEATVKVIGENIGLYEKAEITSLTARMKVHIDGMLPLITTSVVEFPNGDEVTTTLVYERLDKHCTKCMRLGHELKECLVARAEAKALRAAQETDMSNGQTLKGHETGSNREVFLTSAQNAHKSNERDHTSNEPFQFSASNQRKHYEKRSSKAAREALQQRPYKEQSRVWQERGSTRRLSQARERSRGDIDRSSRPSHEPARHRLPPAPPIRSYHREVQKEPIMAKDMSSSASRNLHKTSERGFPQEKNMERVRQAEERGQMEEAVIQMVRASLTVNSQNSASKNLTPERPPASLRLGTNPQNPLKNSGKGQSGTSPASMERIPAPLRLAPPPPNRAKAIRREV